MDSKSLRSRKKALKGRRARRLINLRAYDEILKRSTSMQKALYELKLAGYRPGGVESPSKWIHQNVMELLAVFADQGHSGSSYGIVLSIFDKLARQENLTALTLADDEFAEPFCKESKSRQNIRMSSIFKDNFGIYWLDAFAKKVSFSKFYGEKDIVPYNGGSWGGTLYETKNGICTGRSFHSVYFKEIDVITNKLPELKTIYIESIQIEVAKDDWWMFVDINNPDYVKLCETYTILYKFEPKLVGKDITELTITDFK